MIYNFRVIKFTHIDGDSTKKVILYALSTCGWCKRAKEHLNKLGVAYDYVDADLVDDAQSKEIESEVIKWVKKEMYPTVVIDNKEALIATDLDHLKKALGK
ncbi:glutaredoxin family protein [Candidatus Saganbacteria bacterium]|nr:glutaredoxin family protein [Candidatus Saganbacteria bacterium]